MRSLRCVAALLAAAAPLSAQESPHEHDPARSTGALTARAGASAILAAVQVGPAVYGRTLAEGYVTQPMLHGTLAWRRVVVLRAMLDFEGATLRRGELTPGAYGEGYVDRRHPHTYLHELVATVHSPRWRGASASLTAGKGFAPFGTDDPMARPLLRYPANHHLAQILERLLVVGAVRWRPLVLEYGAFNGDEPESPRDAPNAVNAWNSRAARLTVVPIAGLELQGSGARVTSPESPIGHGFDHHKTSLSARGRSRVGRTEAYALAEWARTDLVLRDRREFRLATTLVEASAQRGSLRAAARVERTLRPEEERFAENPFRTRFPTAEVHIIGTTRFDIGTLHVAGEWRRAGLSLAPFAEASLARARAVTVPTFFVPRDFYGRATIRTLSAGVRIGAGGGHGRIGRYGSAVPESHDRH